MSEYLDWQALEDLKDKAVAAELYDAEKRLLLFFRISSLRGKVPHQVNPENQLRADLNFLNGALTPEGGLPPLLVWLQNARPLVAGTEQQDFFESLLHSKSGQTRASQLPDKEKVHQEAILFALDDMLDVGYLAQGYEASRSVARLRVSRFDNGNRHATEKYWGTGWLIAPDLLITNYHVFDAREASPPASSKEDFAAQAKDTEVQFDYNVKDSASPLTPILSVEAADPVLDYAIARIPAMTDRKPLVVNPSPVKIDANQVVPLNIIQHPEGQPKRIAIRNNLATPSAGDDLRYFTSTLGGSSGSPVFNDTWKVVALHRGSVGTKVKSFQGRTTAVVNLGTRIVSILDKLPDDLKKGMLLKN
jgi:V8-like Glu-specific endopeptidase